MPSLNKPVKKHMRSLRLSRRLQVVADFVCPGKRTADVGCDHGKLSAFLLESKKTPFVYATDLRPAPLEKAKTLLAERGLEEVSACICCDGLQEVPQTVEQVVIAGMGGEEICHILDQAPWARREDFPMVLCPHSKAEVVRRWLASEGFQVEREAMVEEKGHFYPIMAARFTGITRELPLLECYCGLPTMEGDVQGFYHHIKEQMKAILAQAPENSTSYQLANQLLKEMDKNDSTQTS